MAWKVPAQGRAGGRCAGAQAERLLQQHGRRGGSSRARRGARRSAAAGVAGRRRRAPVGRHGRPAQSVLPVPAPAMTSSRRVAMLHRLALARRSARRRGRVRSWRQQANRRASACHRTVYPSRCRKDRATAYFPEGGAGAAWHYMPVFHPSGPCHEALRPVRSRAVRDRPVCPGASGSGPGPDGRPVDARSPRSTRISTTCRRTTTWPTMCSRSWWQRTARNRSAPGWPRAGRRSTS